MDRAPQKLDRHADIFEGCRNGRIAPGLHFCSSRISFDYAQGSIAVSRECRRARKELEHGLARLEVRCFRSGGNFLLVFFGPRAKEIVRALTRKGTLVRDRSSDFGGEGYVRITLGTLQQTRRLLRELESIL